jgi:hypothetical protein
MSGAHMDPTVSIDLVSEPVPMQDREAMVERFARAVPLDSGPFYRDELPELAARSRAALLRHSPEVIAARFQQADGSEPPFVRVSARASREEPTAWAHVYRGFAGRLRAIATRGFVVVIQPILRDSDLQRLGIRLPLVVSRSEPTLPALIRCTEEVLAAGEAAGSDDPAWRRLWYFGSVGWVMTKQGEAAFAAATQSLDPDASTLDASWDTVAFAFEPAFDLAGITAVGVCWRATEVAAALSIRPKPALSP